MKKSIALIIGLFFLLGFAAAAFAIQADIPAATNPVVTAGSTNIRLSGDLRVRGWYLGNIDSTTSYQPKNSASSAYYDERVRLKLDVTSGPVTGRVSMESASDLAGDNPRSQSYKWGTEGINARPTDIQLLEAWINYAGSGLMGVPSGVKVGHMPLALGPAAIFFDNSKYGDDAIVLYTSPTPNTHLTFLTFKPFENSLSVNDDDLDGYVAVFNGEFANQALGVSYTYLGQSEKAAGDGLLGNLSLQDLGLFGKGNISGVDYTAQADFQFGKDGGFNPVATSSVDAEGYGLWIGLGYKLNPVYIRGLFAYGSGNNGDTGKDKQFITFVNPHQQYYTLVYAYNMAGATGADPHGNGINGGISDTTVFNVGVDYSPLAKLKLSLDGYVLRASEANAAVLSSQFGTTVTTTSKDIGTEVDLRGSYNITKNLVYYAGLGVLSEGDFYKDVLPTTATTNGNATPWVIM
ncbi:MAG: alginate export family protein, partial [Nitrospiraceae bacterium]|nr:alginate export family protein [Nitrospiraceae bacterium]